MEPDPFESFSVKLCSDMMVEPLSKWSSIVLNKYMLYLPTQSRPLCLKVIYMSQMLLDHILSVIAQLYLERHTVLCISPIKVQA